MSNRVRVLLAIVAVTVFGILAYYAKYGPPAELKPLESTLPNKVASIQVPIAKAGNDGVRFEMETRKLTPGSDAVVESVNGFLEGLPMVQPDARLLETRQGSDGLELLFSANFRTTYGTDDESTIIKGILRAVQANSNAKAVVFIAGGTPIETLGSSDLAGPQEIKAWLGG